LPEVAENFIHRVGRTGRNGGHGVASTLFVKEQRSELFQLERALGIKMERLRADETAGLPEKQERLPVNLPRVESVQRPRRFVLAGEVFQAQCDNQASLIETRSAGSHISSGEPACISKDSWQTTRMLIRPATAADKNAIWTIMEPILRAGETYTLPRDMDKASALAYWFSG